ncbi:MAG: hypothetical protein GY863_22615 [bacterium]|nr:hypothetical protein [bacterium]
MITEKININLFKGSKRFVFILILFQILYLSLITNTYAQGDKYSFRLRGLGEGLHGFVDDLYSDLSLNPAYINRFEGNWLYTNLSNLQGKNEASLFGQEATLLQPTDIYPSNLIGTITNKFELPIGIFWENSGYDLTASDLTDDENFTSLATGNFMSEMRGLGTDFTSRSISLMSFYRDYGISVSFHKFGFGMEIENRDINGAFAVDTLGTKVNTAYDEKHLRRNFDFSNTFIGFSIGRVIKKENSEISIAVGRSPEKLKFNAGEVFELFKEPFFGGGEGDFSEFEDKDLGYMELGLRSMYLHLRRKTIKSTLDMIQINNYMLNFTQYSMPFNIDAVERTVNDSLAVIGANRKRILNTTNGIKNADGSLGVNRIELGAGLERHFDNFKSMFAIGVKADYFWGDLDYEFKRGKMRDVNQVTVEIGDPAEEDASYERLISDRRSETTKGKVSAALISIPVGFETKITDKFTIRAGARSVIPVIFDTEWETKIVDDTDELLQTDEDVTTFTPSDGFKDVSVNKIEIDAKSLNLNSYHFGASYKLNEMINIDLLHFAKITELDTWWLSIVIKY